MFQTMLAAEQSRQPFVQAGAALLGDLNRV
jgi:hypothetical protein